MMLIGVRREDKSPTESRATLVPSDLRKLTGKLDFVVQPSPQRAFTEREYEDAGAQIDERLAKCDVILGVKEIPPETLEAGITYFFFSHTIKGQPHNRPILEALIDKGCTLIDYERIVDERGNRLLKFGRFAGLAGAVDALWALGRRFKLEGFDVPFSQLQTAHRYARIDRAREAIRGVGQRIAAYGFPKKLTPFVIAVVGKGSVSRGAQEIFNLLPVTPIEPALVLDGKLPRDPKTIYVAVFGKRDTVIHKQGKNFDLREFQDHPGRFVSKFAPVLTQVQLIVNGIYWEEPSPRLITKADLRRVAQAGGPLPAVIADISCDINGAIESTVRVTTQTSPTYVWDPIAETATDGFEGPRPVVLAVDNLPCEFPVGASRQFSSKLLPYLEGMAAADLRANTVQESGLPIELQRATVVWRGQLTKPYLHLEGHLR